MAANSEQIHNFNCRLPCPIVILLLLVVFSSCLPTFILTLSSHHQQHSISSPTNFAPNTPKLFASQPATNHWRTNSNLIFAANHNRPLYRPGRSYLDDDPSGDQLYSYSSSPISTSNDNFVETFYIRKGANGTLPCPPVSSGDSQSTMNKIEWFKEDKKLAEAESKRIVVWNTKNSIAYLPESGALLFRGVSSEDSGEYKCVLNKTQSNNEIEEGLVRFYVQDVPDPPQMPLVIGFTQRSVNLSWVPSYDYHYSPILHYIIHVREGINGTWDTANGIMTPDNRTQYEIIGLKPFTTYSFRVLAVNAIGVGEPSKPTHYLVTLRQKPDSKLTIIGARNVSSTAIRLDWLPPSINDIHGEFVGYKIRYVHQFNEHAPQHQLSNQSNGGRTSVIDHAFNYNHQSQSPSHPQRPIQSPSLDGPLAKEISVGDTQLTSYVIKGLQIYTLYKISVQVTNPAGDGPVAEVLAMTDEGVASPPSELAVLKATDTAVKLRWLEPKSPNGILQGYQINLHDIANNLNDVRRLSDPQSIMEHTIGSLKPYTWYLVNIQAYSQKFLGEPSQQVKFRTDVSAPSPPQYINVTCFSSDSILIQWHRPEQYFNQIDYYYVRYKSDSSWEKEEETTMSAKKDKLLNELLITNLTADQLYELKVLAGTRSIHDINYVYKSEPSQIYRVVLQPNCENPTSANTASNSSIVSSTSPSSSNATKSSSTITTSTTAEINSGSNAKLARGDHEKKPAKHRSQQQQQHQHQQQQQHQVDSVFKNYFTQLVLTSNVPFAYAIILVAFFITIIASSSIIAILTIILTLTGYTAYPITENTFNTSMTLGIVCAAAVITLVTASLIFWRRQCQAAYYYLDEPQDASRGTNSPQLSETYDDSEYGSIPVNDWAKHVQKLHADSDIGFTREFEQIAGQKNSLLTCEHSYLPENKPKNRYTNIVAYDHTRVVLRPPLGGQKKLGFDYINANFIDGYNKPRAYIGTQGPLVSTFDDYWRMIWEQRVAIIVMITNLQERGRRKCDLYWPKDGTDTYGYIEVKLVQEVVMATYTLRSFVIKNLKLKKKRAINERKVYQYHYTNWPDHGVPDHPLPVLSFVRKSAQANPPGAGAIICHCSAGCGRSGTYIVIDAMLKQILHRQSINVVDFLKHIRTQRNYLVQTEEQYIFIHDALVEAIESGYTEVQATDIGKYIQMLQTGGFGNGNLLAATTGSSKQLNSNSNYSIANGFCQSPTSNLMPTPQQQQQQIPISVQQATPASMQVGMVNQDLMSSSNSQNNLLIANSKPGSQATTVSRSQSGQANGGQWSLLERQYRLVASFKAKDFCVVSALKPCNKNKNRTLNLIPLEAHRVHITPKPGVDGSDYINATFLMGWNHLREFIVTQHPVQETFSDFWQMVYDHNSQRIVLLTQMNDLGAEFGQFWPQKEDEVDYGSFKVKLINESTTRIAGDNNTMIITREFIMRSNQDDYELQTKIIHCPGWPESCGPLSAVFDLIQVVHQGTQEQASQQQMHDRLLNRPTQTITLGQEHEPQNGGPVIVVDKFGGTEAATFAVLTTLYKQILFEQVIDVYMYAKLAHLRRPGIWSSQDDYLFLYRAMENFATSLMAQQQQQQKLSADKQAANLLAATAPISHQTMTLDRHRHNNKSSSSSSNGFKTSTMGRRKHDNNANNQHQQQQLHPLHHQQQTHNFQPIAGNNKQAQTFHFDQMVVGAGRGVSGGVAHNQQLQQKQQQQQADFVARSQQQQQLVSLDHNHNTIQYVPTGAGAAGSATISHLHYQQQHRNNNQPKQQHLAHHHNQQLGASLQPQQQQQLPSQTPLSKAEGSPYNSTASIGANSNQHLLVGSQTKGSQRSPQGLTPTSQTLAGSNQVADQYIYSIQ